MSALPKEIKPKFIPDQRIYSLDLTPEERFRARDYLQLEKLPDRGQRKTTDPELQQVEVAAQVYRDRWREEPSRFELLSDPSHKRVCITVSAGVGKSKAMEQLVVLRQAVDPDHLVILVHFSELRTDPRKFIPFLVKKFTGSLKNLPEHLSCQVPPFESPKHYIRSLLRTGKLTLAVDGLDEENVITGKKKAAALRSFLTRFPNCCCCVAGRPYAIIEYYWRELLSTHGLDNDASSDWEFWLVGSFTNQQIQDYLGPERYQELQILQADIEFTPRVLESFRSLQSDVLSRVRSVADVYWFSIDKSLKLDRHKIGRAGRLDLEHDEILDFLSACAITLVLWQHDPMSEGDRASGRVDIGQEPVRRLSKLSKLSMFRKLVFERMLRIYGEDWPIKKKWKSLLKLNSSHVEFGFFSEPEPDSLIWRDATDRDFFAALWMVRSSNEEERAWLAKRQSLGIKMQGMQSFTELFEVWRFICGIPTEAFALRDDGFGAADRWLDTIAPLFRADLLHRPTELMYRAWPNLLFRAGYLKNISWTEYGLLEATMYAQKNSDPKNSTRQHDRELDGVNDSLSNDRNFTAVSLVSYFLGQYPALRDGETFESKICQEDLEKRWCDCESRSGMTVRVGHSDEEDNIEREEIIRDAFLLCALEVTERLYWLFDIGKQTRLMDNDEFEFDDYDDWQDYEEGNDNYYSPFDPAYNLTWYEAIMFSIWCHGYLPSEWEWEYASRAECRLPSGRNAKYHWGETTNNPWMNHNPWYVITDQEVPQEQGSALPNSFGLYATLGNVAEWCRNRYASELEAFGNNLEERLQYKKHHNRGFDVSWRAIRGGTIQTWEYFGCSTRDSAKPSHAPSHTGCRVCRPRIS